MSENIPAQWTTEGFMQVYDNLIVNHPGITYYAAYHEAEKQHIAIFGKPRYSSYDSFRKSRKNTLTKNG